MSVWEEVNSLIGLLKLFLFGKVAVHIFENSAFRNPFIPAAKEEKTHHRFSNVISVIIPIQIDAQREMSAYIQLKLLTFCSIRCNE